MDIVNAVVVTYNRKEMLAECLNALLMQSYKINRIIIVDNASTDGTREMLINNFQKSNVTIFTFSKNSGGSGGFYFGTKEAIKDCDWVWEMDDDTIPSTTSLEELIKAKNKINGNISFLASSVYGMDREPMNVPNVDLRINDNGYTYWYEYLKEGIVKIESATLVSLLFNAKAIKKIGAPHPYFFIWGDDTEYTLRLTRNFGNAYFVGKSEVLHKRKSKEVISVFSDNNKTRIKFYKYLYRNNILIKKEYYPKRTFLKFLLHTQLDAIKVILNNRKYCFSRYLAIQLGVLSYFLKTYNDKAFKNRFDNINQNYLDELVVEKHNAFIDDKHDCEEEINV